MDGINGNGRHSLIDRMALMDSINWMALMDGIMSQTVLLCTISNDCMAPYWGPRGAYVMSYQANLILKT
jgi:hypothetical protein